MIPATYWNVSFWAGIILSNNCVLHKDFVFGIIWLVFAILMYIMGRKLK